MGILAEDFQSKLALVAEAVEMQGETMERRFAAAEACRKADFEFLCQQIGAVDRKLDQKIDHLDERLSQKINTVEHRLDKIEQRLGTIAHEVKTIRQDLRHVHQRLGEHDIALGAR